VVFGAVYGHADSAALGVIAKGLLGIGGIRPEKKLAAGSMGSGPAAKERYGRISGTLQHKYRLVDHAGAHDQSDVRGRQR
jgi:hypothetical protein